VSGSTDVETTSLIQYEAKLYIFGGMDCMQFSIYINFALAIQRNFNLIYCLSALSPHKKELAVSAVNKVINVQFPPASCRPKLDIDFISTFHKCVRCTSLKHKRIEKCFPVQTITLMTLQAQYGAIPIRNHSVYMCHSIAHVPCSPT
jgi:hypothetical protein